MKQILENWNGYLRDERWGYRLLSETSFSRIVTDYGERGYIIITSDRSCEAEYNLPLGKQCSEEEVAEAANSTGSVGAVQETRDRVVRDDRKVERDARERAWRAADSRGECVHPCAGHGQDAGGARDKGLDTGLHRLPGGGDEAADQLPVRRLGLVDRPGLL